MALKSLKYIQFDDEKGALYSAGKQSLLIPVDFIIHLNSILSELAGQTSSHLLLYKIGQALGEGYAETLEKILKDEKIKLNKETMLKEVYNAISTEAGWGLIEIPSFDFSKRKITIKITNSISSQLIKNANYNLEKGVLSGAYKKIIGEDIYFNLMEENKKEGVVTFNSAKEIPAKLLVIKKMTLLSREELETKIKKNTEELENIKKALLNMLEDMEEARQKIDEEKNKTLSIITNLSDGLLVFEKEIFDANNKLILMNPQAENILEVKNEKLLGKSFGEISSSPRLKLLIDLIKREPKKTGRQQLDTGENLIIEVSVIPLIRGEKKIGSLIILHDISREKEIERIKSEFVSTAAHQLRTPLSAIKWTLQMIISGDLGYLSPEQKTFLMQGYKSNERMIDLVNDLLNVSRIEEGRFGYQFSLVQLEDLIQSVTQDFTHQIEMKKISFQYLKPPKLLPKVNIDSAKMRLALANLIDNAIKYTSRGGRVTISLRYDNMYLEVAVKDSGIGIPKKQQKQLFSKFFRSENAVRAQTEGSGLGLFIVKNIIEKHKGRIWFTSEENKGTAFYFTLPVAS